jgi:hypothetical protein
MSKRGLGKLWALCLGVGIAIALAQPSMARENGAGLEDHPGGGTNGSSADNIPVGIFMVDQFFTDQNTLNEGPGAAATAFANGGHAPTPRAMVNTEVFIFNPGWTFLGATTQFIIAQPFLVVATTSGPGNNGNAGVNDTLFKADAAWKFGDWHVKLALGFWAPTGTQQGPAGLNNTGLPFWTIQPEFVLSWEGDAWNLTAYTFWEIDTQNQVTGYQNAPIFHADFTATKTFGKWTVGPVADFFTQVGHDTSSSFYANGLVNSAGQLITCTAPIGFQCLGAQNFTQWAIGGLIQYNFGPVTAQLWATDIVYSKKDGATLVNGVDPTVTNTGYTVWFQISYALWTPPAEEAPAKRPLIYK